MQCVSTVSIGLQDGSSVVVFTPSPTSQVCPFVVVSQAEWSALEEKASANPLLLSVEDGALISGAIVTLWCIAWAVRAVRRALD